MNAASTLATKICQRSTERVRIVFSVPLPSSVATMSPATSAVISGKNQNAAKNMPDQRDRQPGLANEVAERDPLGAVVVGQQCRDEDQRHQQRAAEPDVGALLRRQLAQLPGVDRGDARPAEPDRDGAHVDTSIGSDSGEPSVIRKNSSSSVAVRGTSARSPIPAWARSSVNAATARSSAANDSPRDDVVTS